MKVVACLSAETRVDGPELRLRCVVEPDEELASLLDRMGLRIPKRLRAPDGVHAM